MKKDKRIIYFTGAVFFSFGVPMLVQWIENNNPFNLQSLLLGSAILIIVLLTGVLFDKIVSKIANKPVHELKKKLIPSFLLFTFLTFVIAFSIFYSSVYILYQIKGWNKGNFIDNILEHQFLSGIVWSLFGILSASVFFMYTVWRQATDREQQLREENLKYKYRTLKTQVNPHFLFNSLTTLSEMVYVDAKKADHYIQKLAGIYRYILEHEETDLIVLSKEIAFVKQYFNLQKERDGRKIQLDICIENIEQFKIIPISLQILVENALKHNSASEEKPLKIQIYEEKGYIIVSNTIQRKTRLINFTGTGLANMRQRAKLITGKEVIQTEENNLFVVKLPLISA